jgi:hypothetical protein
MCLVQEEKTIDTPSLIDVLWEALQDACETSFLMGPHLPRAVPIFQSLLTVIQSRHPSRMILLSQAQFWSKVHTVWTAALDRMEVAGIDGHVALVTHIVDLVTCVVFDVWSGHSNDLQPGSGRRSLEPEGDGTLHSLPELSSSVNLAGASMHEDLKKLVSDIFSPDGILSTWILHHAQSKSLLNASVKAEALLTEAAEAAAVLARSTCHSVAPCIGPSQTV